LFYFSYISQRAIGFTYITSVIIRNNTHKSCNVILFKTIH